MNTIYFPKSKSYHKSNVLICKNCFLYMNLMYKEFLEVITKRLMNTMIDNAHFNGIFIT